MKVVATNSQSIQGPITREVPDVWQAARLNRVRGRCGVGGRFANRPYRRVTKLYKAYDIGLMLRVELHAHTSDDPCDRIPHSAIQLIDRAVSLGYRALAITLHNRQLDVRPLVPYAAERGSRSSRGSSGRSRGGTCC